MRRDTQPRTDRGQVLVIFALMLTVLVAMAGLVLDGGSTYAQKRSQQNAADLAALAGADDFLVQGLSGTAIDAARRVATANGYTNGINGVSVDVTVDGAPSGGTRVTVAIEAPHRNGFSSVLGFSSWPVGTHATALAGVPNTADAPAPFIFSILAFNADGTPRFPSEMGFGEANGDVPISALDIAWTNYGTGNVNTNEVRQIITGELRIVKTIDFGTYIGQHNQGNHTALYGTVADYLIGKDVPVPVVDANGNFMGWAMFHVTGSSGGSTKQIRGYFVSGFSNARLTIGACDPGPCTGTPGGTGTYILKLID